MGITCQDATLALKCQSQSQTENTTEKRKTQQVTKPTCNIGKHDSKTKAQPKLQTQLQEQKIRPQKEKT